MKQMDTPLPGIISVVLATLFEILLLALTIVKVCKNTTSTDSLPSSPIVCMVFHFTLSSKLISVSQMRVVVRDEILYVQ
jgi:CRISPR/Cas system type I-B associated protein Csh2 (Cas7 group RAMP superfamily)